jgi:hypothetical protein
MPPTPKPKKEKHVDAGQPVRVTQGMPDVTVRVLDDNIVIIEGVRYTGGDEFTMGGPMAESYEVMGYLEILP